MFSFQKWLLTVLMSIILLAGWFFVFAGDTDPNCEGIDEGVVVCDHNSWWLYAECYDGEALQMIGDNDVWQKAPTDLKNIISASNFDREAESDVYGTILEQYSCSRLVWVTSSYEWPDLPERITRPDNQLYFILVGIAWLLFIILLGLMWRRHCEAKKKK